MFKFNFSNPDEDITRNDSAVSDTLQKESKDACTGLSQWMPANEIFPSSGRVVQDKFVRTFSCAKYQLQHVPFEEALKDLHDIAGEEYITEAEVLRSDLLSGKYEGGLKIWECTKDLADFLVREGVNFMGKHVLDLGCGAGLLGILAIHLGAESVHFQDYNASVIRVATIPNVMLNLSQLQPGGTVPSSRFFAGDWKDFARLISEERSANKYDCILTSETIYNPDNHGKLLAVFKDCLRPGGVIYLAAKVCYFGVGGSIRQFETLLVEDGTFQSKACWVCSQGVQREILQINFHHTADKIHVQGSEPIK